MEEIDYGQLFINLHEYHKRLWDWLAKNPEYEKYDWPEWISKGGKVPDVVSDCFACTYDEIIFERNGDFSDCKYCPITWKGIRMINGTIKPFCNNSPSEFWRWRQTTDPVERTRLAEIIRDMPWTNKG